MPADNKRKLQTTGKPLSTRRKAKKAKLAATQEKSATTTPSHKDRRNAPRPSKRIKITRGSDEDEGEDADTDRDGDSEEDHEPQNKDDTNRSIPQQSLSSDDDEDDDEIEDKVVTKGRTGYRKKVKKPSGKKGKVFADTVRVARSYFDCFSR